MGFVIVVSWGRQTAPHAGSLDRLFRATPGRGAEATARRLAYLPSGSSRPVGIGTFSGSSLRPADSAMVSSRAAKSLAR